MKSTFKLFTTGLIMLSTFACSIEDQVDDAIPADSMTVDATTTTENSVELSWSPYEGASWFKIFYGEEGESLQVEVNYQDLRNDPITYTVDGLSPATNYEFKIEATAYHDDGDILAEGTTTATTDATQQ